MKNEILWNTDIFADMISSNEKIISLCEEVKGALPGFSCLSECGLFTEGLSSIESMTSSLEDSVNGLSQMVKQHNESIASRESKIESLYRDTPFVSLGNVKNFKDYAMGSVPFLVAGAASKYSNAESFAQDRYYRMKEEQTRDPQFSSETFEKAQAKDRYYRMKAEQTKEQPFSSETFEKAQAEDRYYRMKEEQTKDPQFSSEVQKKAQAKDRYDKMKVLYSEVKNSTPSSKSTSTVMTYEEYKKGAQKFAQEHGLPEMSDSEMKESYTSYITKQPIIPKTEMKSMPEREVSTPIQEQNTKNNDLSQDRYYRMKEEQTKDPQFSSEALEKAKIEREQKAQAARRHSFDESTRDTGLTDNTNNNVKPSIPEDKYTNNNNSYNNNQDFSSTKNSSDLFNDNENPSKPNDNIDKNYSNEFDYSKDLNQPTKSYEESQTTIEQVKNNSYQPNDIFVNRNQNNYSTKTTEDIINDISSKDDSIISNTQNNNVIKENNNNYDFKNDNNLNAEVQEQYHENNKNDDWLNGIAGVGVAGLGAFGLNNLLKNKHKKSENDTEDDDE